MRVEFLTSSSPSKALDQNQASLINMFIEQGSKLGRYETYALPTPGWGSAFTTLAAGSVVRGLFEHNDVLYAVAANKFYSIASNGTATERGTLSTSTGRVYFTGIVDYLIITTGTNGYTYVPSTTTFAQIADADFPQTATSVVDLDEYAIVTKASSNQFQISSAGNPTAWASADTAAITSNSGNISRVIVNRHLLWFFGPYSAEIWFNSDAATFPFERVEGTDIDYGLAAKDSLVSTDNNLIFLGQSQQGGPLVLHMDSYSPSIISTPEINTKFGTYTTVSDAFAFVYAQDGHSFYVLTFPTENVTWVYDITTKTWHERQSDLGSGTYGRWRPNCYAYCYGKYLVGDYNSGAIYNLSTTTYQENSTNIRRRLVTPIFSLNESRYTINKFQLVLESAVASSPEFDLEVSRNAGRTFGTAITKNLGTTTDYGKRIIYDRLGQCRTCVFRITTTMNAKFMLLGAQIQITLQDQQDDLKSTTETS